MSLPLARRAHFFVEPGDMAPSVNGVGADNAFFSLDAQSGRAAALLIVRDGAPPALAGWLQAARDRRSALAGLECDLRLLIDLQNRHAALYAADAFAGPMAIFGEREALARWGGEGPFLVLIDRAARVTAIAEGDPERAFDAALAAAAALPREAAHDDPLPAPVLVVPNVLSPDFCRALIAHFEASPHEKGGMAGRDAQGRGYHKIDETKKKRHDFVLGPNDPMLSAALGGIIRRVIPKSTRRSTSRSPTPTACWSRVMGRATISCVTATMPRPASSSGSSRCRSISTMTTRAAKSFSPNTIPAATGRWPARAWCSPARCCMRRRR